jgi:hypothetical protein
MSKFFKGLVKVEYFRLRVVPGVVLMSLIELTWKSSPLLRNRLSRYKMRSKFIVKDLFLMEMKLILFSLVQSILL